MDDFASKDTSDNQDISYEIDSASTDAQTVFERDETSDPLDFGELQGWPPEEADIHDPILLEPEQIAPIRHHRAQEKVNLPGEAHPQAGSVVTAQQVVEYYHQLRVYFSNEAMPQLDMAGAQVLIEHRQTILDHIIQHKVEVGPNDPFILSIQWAVEQNLIGKEDLVFANLAMMMTFNWDVIRSNIQLFRDSYPMVFSSVNKLQQLLYDTTHLLYETEDVGWRNFLSNYVSAWMTITALDNEFIESTSEDKESYWRLRTALAYDLFSHFTSTPTEEALAVLVEKELMNRLETEGLNVEEIIVRHMTYLLENTPEPLNKPAIWRAVMLKGNEIQQQQLKKYMDENKDYMMRSQFTEEIEKLAIEFPKHTEIKDMRQMTKKKGFASPSKNELLSLLNKSPIEAYLALDSLKSIRPDLEVPKKLQAYLAENTYEIVLSAQFIWEEDNTLEQACLWYMHHDVSSQKKSHVANSLIWAYSESDSLDDLQKSAELLPRVQSFDISRLIFALENLAERQAKAYPEMIRMPEPERSQTAADLDNIAREFLVHTHHNQRYVNVTDDLLRDHLAAQASIFSNYYQNKTTDYTAKDISILTSPFYLQNGSASPAINYRDFVNKAVEEMKSSDVNFIKNRDNWQIILLSNDDALKGELAKYVQSTDEYEMAYLARVHNKILALPDVAQRFGVMEYCTNQKEMFLKMAAIRGNRYAQQKLEYLKDEDPERANALDAIYQKVKEIDEHISLLQEAKVARGARGFKYLFFGRQKTLDKQIKELENNRLLICEFGNNIIKDENFESKSAIAGAENLAQKSRRAFQGKKRLAGFTGGILNVLSLGTYPLYKSIQNRVADNVVGTAPLKGSSYKWWRSNYNLLVDSMDLGKDECQSALQKESAANQKALEEFNAIQEKVAELTVQVETEKKPIYMRFFGLKTKAEKELLEEKGKHATAKKEVYRTNRDKNSVAGMDFYKDAYPGLEIEERTVVTEDGKHLDILIVNNKNAQLRNSGQIKDVIHFSGSDCFYQLDTRQFEHAIAQGSNIVVVHDRKKSPESGAAEARKSDLAVDGEAAVNYVINMRMKQAEIEGKAYDGQPVIHGYCGGGPIAILTEKRLRKKGKPLKFIADRTFHTTSAVIRSVMGHTTTNDSFVVKAKAAALNTFIGPVLRFTNWETYLTKELEKIPEDQVLEYDFAAPTPDYYEDLTIETKARVFRGMKEARDKKVKALEDYQEELIKLMEMYISPTMAPSERQRVIEAFDALNKTIEYIKESYNLTQVLASQSEHLIENPLYDPADPDSPKFVPDPDYHGHVEATADFLLRDQTELNARIYDFVNDATVDEGIQFQPLAVSLAPEADQKNLNKFWYQSLKMFEDFYANGQRMQQSHHADHDIRFRINDFISAINTHNLKLQSDKKMVLVLPETAEQYSPQIIKFDEPDKKKSKESKKRSRKNQQAKKEMGKKKSRKGH